MHYSSQTAAPDAVEKDRSEIGLVFAKEITPATKLITTNSIGNIMFKIPAGAEHHRVTACKQVKRDTTIYGLMPHMHLRGKSMEYKVFYPDGKSEVLLNVPNYDFSWQTDYILKQPKRIPAGSRLMVTAYFDNSATKVLTWFLATYAGRVSSDRSNAPFGTPSLRSERSPTTRIAAHP